MSSIQICHICCWIVFHFGGNVGANLQPSDRKLQLVAPTPPLSDDAADSVVHWRCVRVAGPMMLLEMCEEPLKDWLAARQSLTTDDLEAILGFAQNIARGVEHLHSLKVSMQPSSMMHAF